MTAALKTAELSPEALAFIRQGTPKPEAERLASKPIAPASEIKSQPPENDAAAEAVARPKPRIQARQEAAPVQGPLVGLSFRLPAEIHHALMRASFERKMQRQEPWTQQEIAAEALAGWLKKQGYL